MKNDVIKLSATYTKMIFRSWFQYKVDAILRSLAVFMREATSIIVIYFTLTKFDSINGWNIYEMLLLFSLVYMTYGILIIFFTGLRDFGHTVRDGSFDRYILRPRGLLFQLIFANADWFAAVGHGGLGILLFVISAAKLGVVWTPLRVLYYVFAIIGGVLIQGAIFLFLATLNIYLLETNMLKEVFYWNMRKFSGYPMSIFHKAIQFVMTFIVPFAFVNYFPAQFILRKDDMAAYSEIFMYIAPFVGIVLYMLAYLFWRFSIKYYKSSGN
ncbi:MAG: ABC transporter permease [Lachnospiraceae bacterium]|nr:ABC transporter permease [Lachnospiraceae bacterium]